MAVEEAGGGGCGRAERVAAAEREVEISRQRLHDTHENVVKPLQAAAAHNNFAAMIAESLAQGRRKGAQG